MSDSKAELSFELPDDLRQEILDCATAHQISYEWLVGLYRRGYNAKLGATGRYPYGPLGATDEGELTAAVVADPLQQIIRIEFGKPVTWVALTAAHARHFAKLLVANAEALDRSRT